MSLKSFHLLVVIITVVASSAFGMWCAFSGLRAGDQEWLLATLLSFGAGAAMVVHGVTFYKKTEGEPWL